MSEKRSALEAVTGPVSRETFDALLLFETVFLKWNSKINLTSQSTIPDFWQRHIVDSAQLWPLLKGARQVVDFGSGGGLPGVIIAMLMLGDASRTIHLIESNGKKVAFLKTVLAEVGSRASVHAARINRMVDFLPPPDLITARAFASLKEILTLAEPWLAQGTRALLHKGRDYMREVEDASDEWTFDLVQHPSVTERGSVILDLRRVRRRTTSSG